MNPFTGVYTIAKERIVETRAEQRPIRVILNPQMRLIIEKSADRQWENLPTSNEVTLILPDEYGDKGPGDIVLVYRSDENGELFHRINQKHAAYMPLRYMLLFPYGKPS